MTEGPYGLPDDWQWKKLDEVCKRTSDTVLPCETPDKEYNYIGLEHLHQNQWEEPKENCVYGHEIKSNCVMFQPGYVLYAKLRPYLNKVVICTRGGLGSTEFIPILPSHNSLIPDWLGCYLRSPWFVDYASHNTTGSRMPRTRLNALWNAPIPVPPLLEQHRIVAKIDELMGRVREARRLRTEAHQDAELCMPSTIDEIFESKKDDWDKEKIGNLVSNIRTGTTPPSKERKYFGGDIPWFTPGDLGEIKWLKQSERTITPVALKENKAKIFDEGTIMFVGIGATLGKVGISAGRISANQQITGLKFGDKINPEFAYYWFRCNYSRIRSLSPAATLPIINQNGLKSLFMQFPPLTEQRGIVAYLDQVQAQVTSLKRAQEDTESEFHRLEQSILDRAFRGQL